MKHILSLVLIIVWVSGIVLAKGFLSTLFSVLAPPWAYYLVIEKVMIYYGVIPC